MKKLTFEYRMKEADEWQVWKTVQATKRNIEVARRQAKELVTGPEGPTRAFAVHLVVLTPDDPDFQEFFYADDFGKPIKNF